MPYRLWLTWPDGREESGERFDDEGKARRACCAANLDRKRRPDLASNWIVRKE